MLSASAALTGPLKSTTISVTKCFLFFTTSTLTTVTSGAGVDVDVGADTGVTVNSCPASLNESPDKRSTYPQAYPGGVRSYQ